MKAEIKRRRRRDYRVCRIAEDLGISGRTLKRRLNRHPDLAVALHAIRCEEEWRFDYPRSEQEYRAYVSGARTALDRATGGRLSRRDERERELIQECITENFGEYTNADRAELVKAVEAAQGEARLRAELELKDFDDCRREWIEPRARQIQRYDKVSRRRLEGRFGAKLNEFFGFGDEQRERDVARLTLALKRKWAKMQRDSDGGWLDTDFDRWQADAKDIPATARQVASRFNCSVKDAINHWRENLERENEKNRHHNEQEIDSLRKEGKLAENVERTLREADVTKGVCDFSVSGCHIQLWQVKTPAQIAAECERVEELWPDPQDWPNEHWEIAEKKIKRSWERETLYDAAVELVRENVDVTAENLRLLLYRDENHEIEYKNNRFRYEEEKKLKAGSYHWFGQAYLDRPAPPVRFERTNAFYGERGISRREFCQRYTKQHIKEAHQAAVKVIALRPRLAPPTDDERLVIEEFDGSLTTSQPDQYAPTSAVEIACLQEKLDGVSYLDDSGKPLLSDEDRERQWDGFVDPNTARKVREQFQHREELIALLASERTAERMALEQVLGCSLESYIKNPSAEITSATDIQEGA